AQRLLPDAPVLLEALAALGERPSAEQGTPPAPATPDMEALARTLHGAKLELRPPEGAPEPTEPGPLAPSGPAPEASLQSGTGEASTAPNAGSEGARLVSATLAEIYVQQGQYAEAIRAYRALIERQPDERERYEKRIGEIEGISRRAPRPE
ncbi:MAG TPA: tetratricopeptide repeat protein, partial [Bacteroidota bacterium]